MIIRSDLFSSNNRTFEIESKRYKTLLSLGKLISIIGWFVVFLGGILFIVGLGQLNEGYGIMSASGLVSGIIVSVFGLICVAFGQVISCFVSIENNTNSSMSFQKKIMIQK